MPRVDSTGQSLAPASRATIEVARARRCVVDVVLVEVVKQDGHELVILLGHPSSDHVEDGQDGVGPIHLCHQRKHPDEDDACEAPLLHPHDQLRAVKRDMEGAGPRCHGLLEAGAHASDVVDVAAVSQDGAHAKDHTEDDADRDDLAPVHLRDHAEDQGHDHHDHEDHDGKRALQPGDDAATEVLDEGHRNALSECFSGHEGGQHEQNRRKQNGQLARVGATIHEGRREQLEGIGKVHDVTLRVDKGGGELKRAICPVSKVFDLVFALGSVEPVQATDL